MPAMMAGKLGEAFTSVSAIDGTGILIVGAWKTSASANTVSTKRCVICGLICCDVTYWVPLIMSPGSSLALTCAP